MDSPAYSVRLETAKGEKVAGRQALRRRNILIVSLVCFAVVLLLAGLAGGAWHYGKPGETATSKRTSTLSSAFINMSRQSESAGAEGSAYGSQQQPVSSKTGGGQTGVDDHTSGISGGSGGAQMADNSVLGRARLFYANNRRAVLIAIAVSVVIIVAIVATLTTLLLLHQRQAVDDMAASNGITIIPNPAPSINIPLVAGLSAGIFAVLLVTSIIVIRKPNFRPAEPVQFFVHLAIIFLFLSPAFVVLAILELGQRCGPGNVPAPIRIVLKVIWFIIALPFIVLSLFAIPIQRLLPPGAATYEFGREMEAWLSWKDLVDDPRQYIEDRLA